MPAHPDLTILLGDIVRLRRPHPCGGTTWLVDRLGADIGLRCQTCARRVLMTRHVLERRFAGFETRADAISGVAAGRASEDRPR